MNIRHQFVILMLSALFCNLHGQKNKDFSFPGEEEHNGGFLSDDDEVVFGGSTRPTHQTVGEDGGAFDNGNDRPEWPAIGEDGEALNKASDLRNIATLNLVLTLIGAIA